MNLSIKKAMRAYFAGKLRLGLFWFAIICAACYAQIELFYGPLDWFYDSYPYITGVIAGVSFAAFGISLGYLLTRLVTRINYTGRLRRDLGRVLPPGEAANPYAVLDADMQGVVQPQPWPRVSIYLGERWLVMPGHALLRAKIVGIFYEELNKSFLSNKVRLTIIDEMQGEMYLDIKPEMHPEIFQTLARLHPAATDANHRVWRSLPEESRYNKLRQNNEPPLPLN